MAAVLKRERGYFSSNAARMQYPTLRKQQLPIGSGAVEASAKHLVQHRMQRAASRWSDLGARAILDLRCYLLSGRSHTALLDFLQTSVKPLVQGRPTSPCWRHGAPKQRSCRYVQNSSFVNERRTRAWACATRSAGSSGNTRTC